MKLYARKNKQKVQINFTFIGQVYTLRSFQKEWKGVECKCKLTKKLKTLKNNGGKIVQILRYWGQGAETVYMPGLKGYAGSTEHGGRCLTYGHF